jgi:arachidonate 5-lipoxygenase
VIEEYLVKSNWFTRQSDLFTLWFTSVYFHWRFAVMHAIPKRYRMSHNNGIAARGKLRIVDHPEFPPHDCFEPGREFPARIRHAMATFLDDAMNGIRSCSIKISDDHWDSPFRFGM